MRSAPSAPAARFEVRHISISTRPDDLGSRSAAQDNSGAVAWSTFGYKQVVTLQSDFLAAWRGVRDALAYPAWIVGFSLFGVGSLARDAGLPAGAAVLSTCLMWAAPAQVILFAGLLSGAALPALAVAICVSSLRFLPMTMSILPLVRRPGQRWPVQVAVAHFVAVTAWVEGMRRLPSLPVPERLPYFFGFASACMGVSAVLTLAGYQLVRILPVALAAGMLMLTPLFFTIALMASARSRQDWTAIGLGFALAPVATTFAGRDFDLLALGLVGGTMAYVVGRMGRRA